MSTPGIRQAAWNEAVTGELRPVNEFDGPELNVVCPPRSIPTINDPVSVIVMLGVDGVCEVPAVFDAVPSSGLEFLIPDHSLTFAIPPDPLTAFVVVIVTEVPVPSLFVPYQISAVRLVFPLVALAQLEIPPPETPVIAVIVAVFGFAPKQRIRAFPVVGVAIVTTIEVPLVVCFVPPPPGTRAIAPSAGVVIKEAATSTRRSQGRSSLNRCTYIALRIVQRSEIREAVAARVSLPFAGSRKKRK